MTRIKQKYISWLEYVSKHKIFTFYIHWIFWLLYLTYQIKLFCRYKFLAKWDELAGMCKWICKKMKWNILSHKNPICYATGFKFKLKTNFMVNIFFCQIFSHLTKKQNARKTGIIYSLNWMNLWLKHILVFLTFWLWKCKILLSDCGK